MKALFKIGQFIFLLSFSLNTISQESHLKIGDKIPDLLLENVLNYDTNYISLSEFKGKNIILDFWNTKCINCIKTFPKIDSLQKEFKNDIQFLLVNKEDKISTISFFEKRKQIRMPGVPFVTTDQVLDNLLPNNGYPYSVWIDKEGIIKYITGGYNITNENIQSFINSQLIDVKDVTIKKVYASLFEHTNKKFVEKLNYYSYFSPCFEDIDVGYYNRTKVSDSTTRISSNCASIIELYKLAYRESDKDRFLFSETIILKVKNLNKYQRPSNSGYVDSWSRMYAYNYDLLLPIKLRDQAYYIMQEDLRRYFNLKVKIKRKRINKHLLDVLILKE